MPSTEWFTTHHWIPKKFCFVVADKKAGLLIMLISRFLIWLSFLVVGYGLFSPFETRLVLPGQPHSHGFNNKTFIDIGTFYKDHYGENTTHEILSVDLTRPFAYYAFTNWLVSVLLVTDVVLACALFRRSAKCMRCWMVASFLVLAKFALFAYFVSRYESSLEVLTPPIFVYFLLDVALLCYHLHAFCYVEGHRRRLVNEPVVVVDDGRDALDSAVREVDRQLRQYPVQQHQPQQQQPQQQQQQTFYYELNQQQQQQPQPQPQPSAPPPPPPAAAAVPFAPVPYDPPPPYSERAPDTTTSDPHPSKP